MSCLNDIPSGWICSVCCTAIFEFSFSQLQSSYLARTSTHVSWVKTPRISACKMFPLNHLSLSVVSGNLTLFSLLEYNLRELPVTSSWQFSLFNVCQLWGLDNWLVPLLLCLVGTAAYVLERQRYCKLNLNQFVSMLGKTLEYPWAWKILYPIN